MIKPEFSGGMQDFTSLMLRMLLYKQFIKRCKNNKLHFITLEMDENELRQKFLKQFTEKIRGAKCKNEIKKAE